MAGNKDLGDIRKDYIQPAFGVDSVEKDPFVQFDKWFEEIKSINPDDCNSMTLATATEEGRPSARVVLLKGIENYQFVFYTNYQSAKGQEIIKNPSVCLNFYWPELSRQIRIDGLATRVSEETSLKYFQSRPRESQLSAWASPQSAPIGTRDLLEDRVKNLEEKFQGVNPLPKPKQWGGFAINPMSFEFWQGRPNRLHDRLIYYLDDSDNWSIRRLAP